jgi:hypothetical protein
MRILIQACFNCSEQFWEKMSVIVTNLYEEVDLSLILIILGNLLRENNVNVKHWNELVLKIEKNYTILSWNQKVPF